MSQACLLLWDNAWPDLQAQSVPWGEQKAGLVLVLSPWHKGNGQGEGETLQPIAWSCHLHLPLHNKDSFGLISFMSVSC